MWMDLDPDEKTWKNIDTISRLVPPNLEVKSDGVGDGCGIQQVKTKRNILRKNFLLPTSGPH